MNFRPQNPTMLQTIANFAGFFLPRFAKWLFKANMNSKAVEKWLTKLDDILGQKEKNRP